MGVRSSPPCAGAGSKSGSGLTGAAGTGDAGSWPSVGAGAQGGSGDELERQPATMEKASSAPKATAPAPKGRFR